MSILETINVIKLYKQYDETVTAVNRVNLKVADGEFIAIIGASGSGKSTFLHICAGLESCDSGHVIIRGQDITEMKSDDANLYRGMFVGFVAQKHNLIPSMTALENITLPTMLCNKPEISYEEHIAKLIHSLKLEDRLSHLPSELSGGQQQRVSIARALINRPQLLLADEPTGNLDRENADEVLELLIETKKLFGVTLVIVTHDLKIAERADKIYKMDDGNLWLFRDEHGYRRNSYEEESQKNLNI